MYEIRVSLVGKNFDSIRGGGKILFYQIDSASMLTTDEDRDTVMMRDDQDVYWLSGLSGRHSTSCGG